MLYTLCELPSNSLTPVICQDLIIISGVHGTFWLSTKVHTQNIGIQKFLLRQSLENFDTEIVKKLRKFQY